MEVATREMRLKNLNHGLLSVLADHYHLEQQAVMMMSVNLSAHLLESIKRERVYWEEVIRLTSIEECEAG